MLWPRQCVALFKYRGARERTSDSLSHSLSFSLLGATVDQPSLPALPGESETQAPSIKLSAMGKYLVQILFNKHVLRAIVEGGLHTPQHQLQQVYRHCCILKCILRTL